MSNKHDTKVTKFTAQRNVLTANVAVQLEDVTIFELDYFLASACI